jgi:signal transduction histidine kinase
LKRNRTRQHNHHPKRRKGYSLSLILFLSFSLFALVIIVLCGVIQNSLLVRQYREQTERQLREVGSSLTEQVNGKPWSKDRLTDGSEVLPETDEDFTQIAADLVSKLKESETRELVCEYNSRLYVYISSVNTEGGVQYILVTRSPQSINTLSQELQVRTFIMGLFAMVLSFVVSGIVTMLITKPVMEISDKAKQFARGDYDIQFKENYYCTELTELSDALDYAREEISKADKMQKELIANVSHDFKTPLTMIKAYASMIREISGSDPEKRNAHTQVILDECDRLTALVNDVLDISKLRSGISELNMSVFNLSEFTFGVVDKFGYLVETQGYHFDLEIEDELYTRADREKIGQVLYNLVGNAVNYTGEDKKVTVRLYRKGNVSRFEVADTGNGIPDDELSGIWDRYYRSSETHKRPVKGTGLGLSIVKTTLDRHEFRFGVLSSVGKGSCFWVEFPLPEDETPVQE